MTEATTTLSCAGANGSVSAVLVPLTTRESADLEFLFFLWGAFASIGLKNGEAAAGDVRLIVSLDGEYRQDVAESIAESFSAYGLSRVFFRCDIRFCNIPPDENIYIRFGQKPPETIPPLGLKSGPNTQFFRSMAEIGQNEDVVLLNEVDCFPVQAGWLERLQQLVAGSEPFWVLGSPYRGWGRLGPDILGHVNGNALYGVGTPGFGAFLREWESALREEVTRNPDLAYDLFWAYRHAAVFDPARWSQAPIELFKSLQQMLCMVRYTSAIHNLAGDEELSGRVTVDLGAYLDEHPRLVLAHGRFLRAQVLDRMLREAAACMAAGAAAREALGDYLVDGAQRLLERGNLPAARAIMQTLSSVESGPSIVVPASSVGDGGKPRGAQPAISGPCFAFSLHKAGSTLFYKMLSAALGSVVRPGGDPVLRYVSIPDQLFNSGVPENVLADVEFVRKHGVRFDDPGTLYGGFRFAPAFATDEFLAGRRVMVLVRDPRDVLTSLYFAQQKSHGIPAGEAGIAMAKEREFVQREQIDEFVLRQARQGNWVKRYDRLTELARFGVSWRYEDVVFDKARWLDEMLAYLDVSLPKDVRRRIVEAEDVVPASEDASRHVRQVSPGDHRRKLKPETIAELDRIFADVLADWEYA